MFAEDNVYFPFLAGAMNTITAQQLLDFWFKEIDRKLWFEKNEQFDDLLRQRFGALHAAAAQGELYSWRETLDGRLAEIIVLDQFSRNLYRNDARAFACDGMALVLTQEALAHQQPQNLPAERRAFLYLPLMHSESLLIHELAMRHFAEPGLEDNYRYEQLHQQIIARFGRYPHRNAALGRQSTTEELAFLQQPGSSF